MSLSYVAITAGSGTNVATDVVATKNYQIIKLADGTADGTALIASGGGVEANALRVTVASDSTGVLSVDDNGGSLTVDGTVAISGTVTVGSHAVTNAGTFVVQIDGTALTRLTDIETNTDSGAVVGNGAAATAQRVTLANDSTGIIATVGAVTSITNALPAGTNAIGKLAANSGVDIGDVDVTSVIPGTGATNLGKAIDTATGGTDTGVLALATRDDALSALTPVEGDNIQLRVDANGALWVIVSGTVTVASHAVTNAGTFAVQAASAGDVAHDAADSGNPVKQGGIAQLAAITAVADADRINFVGDSQGRQVVAPHGVRDLIKTQTTTIAASTSETTVVTAVASHFMDLLQVVIANTSGTAARVDFRDTTAGSVIFSLYAPAGATVGFTAAAPLSQTSVNTNWTAQSSASITDLRILMVTRKTK